MMTTTATMQLTGSLNVRNIGTGKNPLNHYVYLVLGGNLPMNFTNIAGFFIDDLLAGAELIIKGEAAMEQQLEVSRFLHFLYEEYDGLIPRVTMQGNRDEAGVYLQTVVKNWI